MQITLLLDSIQAAQEVAFILRTEWDGCNAVTFTDFDELDTAFETVVGIALTEYCHVRQKCLTQDVENNNLPIASSFSFWKNSSRVGCKVIEVSQDVNSINQELVKAFAKRMELAYLIYPNSFDTPKLLAPA